ncbi:MAG: hypothetical protein PVI23_13140 [Maricaulaceae bacterium]|jgi:hypothetical protein
MSLDVRHVFNRSLPLVLLAALFCASCDQGPRSGYGFALPDGEPSRGEAAFARLGCSDCHLVPGRDDLRADVEPQMDVMLGGATTRVRTYGDLVTSIINPSHRISQRYIEGVADEEGVSAMRNYNDVATVSELIDLVAFLQAQYDVAPPTGPSYTAYDYP